MTEKINIQGSGTRRLLKHEELGNAIRDAVRSGRYAPGDMLPSQNEMCKTFGLSHNTVREAIGTLVAEGLLYRTQGKGTFVAERRRSRLTVALVMPHVHQAGDFQYKLGHDIAPLLVHHIEDEARSHGAGILLCLDNDDFRIERENLDDLIERHVDGIILYYIGEDGNLDCIDRIQRARIPLVFIDRYPEELDVDYVISDNYLGAYQAVTTLLNKGFSTIHHFTFAMKLKTVNDRMRGYRDALSLRGIDTGGLITAVPGSYSIAEQERHSYEAARQILQGIEGPFAVFAETSTILVGVWRAIEEIGYDHRNLALACFDSPWVSIPDDVLFLQVIQPLADIGRSSLKIMTDRLGGDTRPQHIILTPSIHMTGTTR